MKSRPINIGKDLPFRFNVMVVGESGLGKTTFLKTLLSDYLNSSTLNFVSEGARNQAATQFESRLARKTVHISGIFTHLTCNSGLSITILSKHQYTNEKELDSFTSDNVKFTIFDSPGYGDHINNQVASLSFRLTYNFRINKKTMKL